MSIRSACRVNSKPPFNFTGRACQILHLGRPARKTVVPSSEQDSLLAVAAVFAVQNGVRQGQGARQAVAYACQRGGTAAFCPADGEDLQDKHGNLFVAWFGFSDGLKAELLRCRLSTLPFKTAVQNMFGACMGRCGGAIRCSQCRVSVGRAVCVLSIFVIRQTVFQTA